MSQHASLALKLDVLLRSHADVYFYLGDFSYAGADSHFTLLHLHFSNNLDCCILITRMPHSMAT